MICSLQNQYPPNIGRNLMHKVTHFWRAMCVEILMKVKYFPHTKRKALPIFTMLCKGIFTMVRSDPKKERCLTICHLLVWVEVHQRWRVTKFLANFLFVIQSNWGLVSFQFVLESWVQDVILQIFQTKTIVGVTNIYIAWTSLEKAQMWKLLEQMDMVTNNWIFGGDFNMVNHPKDIISLASLYFKSQPSRWLGVGLICKLLDKALTFDNGRFGGASIILKYIIFMSFLGWIWGVGEW